MSSENQTSIGSNIVSYVAFPALFSAKHIKNAVKYYRNGDIDCLRDLQKNLKPLEKDTFKRNNILLKQYEELAAAQKLSLKDKFLNIFRKNKIKPDAEKIKQIKNGMKNTEELLKTAGEAGFKNNFKTLFSNGLKDKFGIGITVACAIPDFIEKVVPKFKEGKIGEGIKETGKWAIKTGADFLSFVAGNALGTVIGSVLIPIPGIGAAIGKTFFGMLGVSAMSKISSNVVDKVLGEDKKSEQNIQATQEQSAQQTQQVSYDPDMERIERKLKELNIAI